MRRLALRTGVRWKISIAIAAVGALIALTLSLVVHNAARVSMLENAREVQLERLLFAQRLYEAGSTQKPSPKFGAKINDPSLPAGLREQMRENRRATHVDEYADGVPDVWAAVPLANGDVLSLHTRFADRSSMIMGDLDRALVIGSVSVVFGGCALGVLIGGQLSRRLRKAAAAAGKVAQGNTEVRVREAVGGVVRDRAQAMRTLVEDVLEVARLDSASERAELQELPLGEFVGRRVRLLDPEITVCVLHESWVSTDPRRLERILGNLLGNAAKHGAGPVEVTVEGRVVRVRDHGPGFPEALLQEGPSRFRTGSTDRAGRGHGLGLTIAAGQARVLGARLTFRNAGPAGGADGTGGAVAVLWLPEHAPTNTGSFPVLPPGPG